jgi:hypothetical protein
MEPEMSTNGKWIIGGAGIMIGIIVLSICGVPTTKAITVAIGIAAVATIVWVMKISIVG